MRRRGRRVESIPLVVLVALVAACSGNAPATQALPTLSRSVAPSSEPPLLIITPPPSATSAPTATASAAPTIGPTSAPTASPSATAAPSVPTAPPTTAPPTSAPPSVEPSPNACAPDQPTTASADWQAVNTKIGTFTMSVPADWVDRSATISVRAGDYFDATTLGEASSGIEDGLAADAFSGPGTNLQNPNFRVLALPGVGSPVDVVGARLVKLYTSSGNQVTDSSVTVCIGGEDAHGLQLLYQKGANFAELLAVEHEGAAYLIEWVADAASIQNDTFAEILRTWSWIPGAGPPPPPSPAPSPTASSTATPTPTPTATPSPTEEAFPNATEAKILEHVPSAIRSSCERVKTIYDRETDSVHCAPAGKPLTDYTLFRTASLMNAAYKADMSSFGNPTKTSGGCTSGRYESTYTIDGVPNGRWACVVDSKKNKVVEWTDDTNLIITYAWSGKLSWQSMYDYWFNDAGPVN